MQTDVHVLSFTLSGDYLYTSTTKGVWKRDISDLHVGVKEINKDLNISIFPNPSEGKIFMRENNKIA